MRFWPRYLVALFIGLDGLMRPQGSAFPWYLRFASHVAVAFYVVLCLRDPAPCLRDTKGTKNA